MVRQGVTSFKMFMAYLGAVMVDDTTIFQTMVSAADNGCAHTENRTWLRPSQAHQRYPYPTTVRQFEGPDARVLSLPSI